MKRFSAVILALLAYFLLLQPTWAQSASPTPEATSSPSVPAVETTPSEESTPPDESVVQTESTPSVTGATSESSSEAVQDSAIVKSEVTSKPLFRVAGQGAFPASDRALIVEQRLANIIKNSPGEMPTVTLEPGDDQIKLLVDGKHFVSVFPADVKIAYDDPSSASMLLVARGWQNAVEEDIRQSLFIKSPNYYWVMGLYLLALFGLAVFIHRKLGKTRSRRTGLPTWLLRTAVWTFYLITFLWTIPSLRVWAVTVYRTAFKPVIWLIGVILVSSLVLHVYEFLLNKYFQAVIGPNRSAVSRQYRRLSTLHQVSLVTGRVLLVLLAIAIYLSMLPINYAPLLASASVVSVALGFASQDILRDLFGGISILAEDRFGVGDVIEWNGQSGSVESFNLKSTKVRKINGSVLIVPNADLRVVCNLSNEWSQVDFQVDISYETDYLFAQQCLLEVAQKFAEENPERVISQPDLKGIEKLGDSGVTLRLFLRTVPLAQWDVQRELNGLVKARFDAEGISIPYPQRRVWMSTLGSEAESSESAEMAIQNGSSRKA